MEKKYTNHFWEASLGIYDQILKLPFNEELKKGILPEEVFLYYMKQDSLYLADFSRALAVTGTKADDTGKLKSLLKFAEEAVVVERALHEHYLKEYDAVLDIEKSPTCEAYTSFLLKMAYMAPFPVAMASLLPCFWIYLEVGHHIHRNADKPNKYQKWIDTYAGEEFQASAEEAIGITEVSARSSTPEIREKMLQAWLKSCRYEWLFWDAARRMERWPV